MSWRNIRLIFLREVRDQLRDRRTLFMIAILPLFLYPAMGIGVVQMTTLFNQQTRTVVVLGAKELPQDPALVSGGKRFDARWFAEFISPDFADKLSVVTDVDVPSKAANDATSEAVAELLSHAAEVRSLVNEHARLLREKDAAEGAKDHAKADLAARQLDPVHERLSALLQRSKVEIVILVPEGFAASLEQTDRELARRVAVTNTAGKSASPYIIHNGADEKSLMAYQAVKRAIDTWEKEIVDQQLKRAGLPPSLPKPVNVREIDVAKQEQIAANVWSKMFPALVVIMAVTGAFYPAIDLGAGEKERGTMETLLICPARRSEIVVGKFFTIMLFSLATAILNLMSMGFTGRYMVAVVGNEGFSNVGDFSLPGPLALTWVLVLLLPLAALFSATSLALATFARSSKEGQYYLTPLLMVTMGLTVFCLLPTVQIEPFNSVMPVVGPALLLKELLSSPGSTAPLVYAIPVLATSFGYSLLAIWWAIDQFSREDVLFREAERFDLRLWVRHLLRDKEPTPSFAEAALCFVLIMLLQFAGMRFFRDALPLGPGGRVDLSAAQPMMLKLLMIQQLAMIATPALLMAVILTTSMVRTLRLRIPPIRMLLAAAVLPVVLHPLTIELSAQLQWFFPPLPKSIQDIVAAMSSHDLPLWLVLLAFAVTPAFCEEVAFRGFILSGFARSGRVGVAILMSSVAFGLMHMIPQQVFNAALLGTVLGLLAVRSKSLLPCILFHLLYNSLEVLRSRFGSSLVEKNTPEWLFWLDNGTLRYGWVTLAVAAVVAFPLLRMLLNSGKKTNRVSPAPSAAPMNGERDAEREFVVSSKDSSR